MPTPPLHECQVLPAPCEGVHATRIRSARHYGRHSHGSFGFGMVDQGAQRSSSGRGVVDAFAGDILTANPGEMHDGRPLAGPARTWCTVYVEPQVLAGFIGLPHAAFEIEAPVLHDPALLAAIRLLVETLQHWRTTRTDALQCEEALVHACGLLVARHTTVRARPEGDARVAAVRDRLCDDLATAPSLAELAALAGASRFQLLRRFAAAYGCTPHAWLVQQRAERARTLIARGTPLAEAAAQCGFADQSHMTRLFTRQFGFTPGAWQRALQ